MGSWTIQGREYIFELLMMIYISVVIHVSSRPMIKDKRRMLHCMKKRVLGGNVGHLGSSQALILLDSNCSSLFFTYC